MIPVFVSTFRLTTDFELDPNAHLWLCQYKGNGGWALIITDASQQEIIVPTVNMEEYGVIPEENTVFLRDFSESQGLVKSMQNAGLVSQTKHRVPVGFAYADEVTLLFNPQTVLEQIPAL